MKKVNTYHIYSLGEALYPLTELEGATKYTWKIIGNLATAKGVLNFFLNYYVPLKITSASANKLMQRIKDFAPDNVDLFGEEFRKKVINNEFLGSDGYLIGVAAKEFRTVLAAELENSDTYHVSKKGIFDTSELINNAQNAFSVSILKQLSTEINSDIQQAGRCIAFELPTACGFHLMRAVEAVMMIQYEKITSGNKLVTKPSERNWGNYIKKLEEAGASKSVTSVLDHMRSLHRNPLMHPEDTLDMNQAITLWGIAQSAIVAMYDDMKVRVQKGHQVSSSAKITSLNT